MSDFISIIDFEFNLLASLWSQIIMQNIYLTFMVVLGLVVMVINLRNNTKQ